MTKGLCSDCDHPQSDHFEGEMDCMAIDWDAGRQISCMCKRYRE